MFRVNIEATLSVSCWQGLITLFTKVKNEVKDFWSVESLMLWTGFSKNLFKSFQQMSIV